MSEIDVKAAEAKLSKSAANLLQRLRKGRWYPLFPSAIGKETPAAMEQLTATNGQVHEAVTQVHDLSLEVSGSISACSSNSQAGKRSEQQGFLPPHLVGVR